MQSNKTNFKLGKFDLNIIDAGNFKLDGGAMFGIVPKTLWSRTNRSDDINRIALASNCLLIRSEGNTILVDTGNGIKFNAKQAKIFSFDTKNTLINSLEKVGITPSVITHVILTHLHFDHSGGATTFDDKKNIVPTFPNAEYIVQKGEFDDAVNNYCVMKGTYVEENFKPIKKAGLLNLVNGDYEVCNGVKTISTGGHTRHHQIVIIESEGQKAIYPGDILPTMSHFNGSYNMAYDLSPFDTKKQKQAFLQKASDEDWLIFLDHDPNVQSCRVKKIKEDLYDIKIKL